MSAADALAERRRQIERLLAYPGVGALTPHGIASNLGATQEELQAALDTLLSEGRIGQTSDGRLIARATADTHGDGRRPAGDTRHEQGEI